MLADKPPLAATSSPWWADLHTRAVRWLDAPQLLAVLDELPLRLAKDRLRLIIGLARYLQTAVQLNAEDLSASRAGRDSPSPVAPRA